MDLNDYDRDGERAEHAITMDGSTKCAKRNGLKFFAQLNVPVLTDLFEFSFFFENAKI